MKIKSMFIFSILLMSTFVACEEKQTINEDVLAPSKEIKKELPTFKLTTTNNEQITIKVTNDNWIFENYKDKVILLNFFTTWCPPCKAEIPHLNKLQKKYKKDFQVLSILVEENKPNDYVNKFIKKFDIQYPVTNSTVNFNLASSVGGVRSIPAMFLFNKNGLLVQDYVGAVYEEILDSDIKKAIGK